MYLEHLGSILRHPSPFSRVFGSDGESIPVTVINIGLNVVSSLRSTDKHGYSAVQIGYKEIKKNTA